MTTAVCFTPDIRLEISNSTPLAPSQNHHNLAAINTLAGLAPDLLQYVRFDTSLYRTNLKVAMRYAVPRIIQTKGIQRYGFYGLSFSSLVRQLPHISGERFPSRLLVFNLGIGASLGAIRNGQSVATTMEYSPLDGLTMGTRSSRTDANAVLRLVEDNGGQRTKAILKHGSDLLGLSGGKSDMGMFMPDPSVDNAFAIENFCYWYLHHVGSLVTTMKHLDAIAFTGGISESAFGVCPFILRGWEWTSPRINPYSSHRHGPRLQAESSKVSIWVVPVKEEKTIAADALALIQAQ